MVQETKTAPAEATRSPLADSPLTSWALPVAGLIGVGVLAIGYFLGLVSERVVGGAAALAFAVLLAVMVIRSAFEKASPTLRAAAVVFAAGLVALTLWPAQPLVAPGSPAAEAILKADGEGASLKAPSGGNWRIQTSAVLPPGGAPAAVNYHLKVGGESVSGRLERVWGYRRARRGATIQVPEDHNVQLHEVSIPEGGSVTLDSLTGEGAEHGLHVELFHAFPVAVLYAFMGAWVLFGMALEGRAPAKTYTMSAAAAVCFGLLIRTADPGTVMGPVFGSVLLGAGGGALGGAILAPIGRKLFGSKEPAKESRQPNGNNKRGEGQGRKARKSAPG